MIFSSISLGVELSGKYFRRVSFFYQADRNRWAHRLEVTLEDGRVLTRQVEYPYGDFNNPFTWAYEHEKFHTLADGVLDPDRVAALVERLPHLEELDDINRLFEGL